MKSVCEDLANDYRRSKDFWMSVVWLLKAFPHCRPVKRMEASVQGGGVQQQCQPRSEGGAVGGAVMKHSEARKHLIFSCAN